MSDVKPAYLVVCGNVLGPPAPEYSKIAAECGKRAGAKPITNPAMVEVLEGELPEGTSFLAVEQFDSMEALREFWYSEEYQRAIPLRKDAVKMNFVAAIEGLLPRKSAK